MVGKPSRSWKHEVSIFYQRSETIRQLFAKRPLLELRATVLIVAALLLMVFDHYHHCVVPLRSALTVAVVPLQYLINEPVKLINWMDGEFSTREDLLQENARLHNEQILLQVRLQKLLALEKENVQLRALLNSSPKSSDKILMAQLLAVDLNPLSRQVVIDRGTSSGVYQDQPVLDAYGVTGQVVEVGQLTSRVMLITDSNSAVPVQIARNGMRAIAVGSGYSENLSLIHVPDTADVQVGDQLITSGLGLRFPPGYPVGEVISVTHISGRQFTDILIKPSAHLNRSSQVLLLWPNQASFMAAVKKLLLNKAASYDMKPQEIVGE